MRVYWNYLAIDKKWSISSYSKKKKGKEKKGLIFQYLDEILNFLDLEEQALINHSQ